jgi:hypothetical protein
MATLPDQNLMTFNAAEIRDKAPEIGFLRGEIRRHIKMIELEIRDAIKSQCTNIVHEVEQNFPVTKCTNLVAQRFVYAGIIDQLKINGFRVQLVMDKKNLYFRITWITEIDAEEVQRQNDLIKTARV